MDKTKLWFALSIFLLAMVTCLITALSLNNINHTKEKARLLDNYTKVSDGFAINPSMTDSEQYYRFYRFMIKIMGTFGYTYDKENPQALSPDQQPEYIKFLWEGAKLMGFNPYRVPSIHQTESSFNPFSYNTNSGLYEKGIGQQCWAAVKQARIDLESLSPQLRRFFDFTVIKSDDLYDWLVATKITFVHLYALDREYRGREEWSTSIYHWGGFLARLWDSGRGDIPNTFTIQRGAGGVKYLVLDYWTTISKLQSAYEQGDLEYGKYIYRKYQDHSMKIMREEISLRNARDIVRKLKQELERERGMKEQAIIQRQDLEKLFAESYNQLTKIYKESGRQTTGEKIRAELLKYKDVVRNILHHRELAKMELLLAQEMIILTVCSIWLLLGLIFFLMARRLFKKGKLNDTISH